VIADPSLTHLHGRLAIVEDRVAAAVARRRTVDPDPDDRFKGLYISESQVDSLLCARRHPENGSEAGPRLLNLVDRFGLDDLDIDLLLVALAPDLDPRFERLYGYLHDDVTRRRASVGLALELCGTGSGGRRRLDPAGALVASRLVLVEDADRPFLTRSLRVSDRVTWHLLGDDTPDPLLTGLLTAPPVVDLPESASVARAVAAGTRLIHVREPIGAAGTALAVGGLAGAGLPAVTLDLHRFEAGDDAVTVAGSAVREARLRGGGVVAGPVEVLAERNLAALRVLAGAACPVIFTGSRPWDPAWADEVPLLLHAPVLDTGQRAGLWRACLNGHAPTGAPDFDPVSSAMHFRLSPEQVVRAARSAEQTAAAEGRAVNTADLQAGARTQNAGGLERLARRIEPRAGWDDLVLPAAVVDELTGLAARVRHRELVLDLWGMGSRSAKGRGITALFAGDSGTGKTLSAEVVAGALGLDLYVIDLSTVIDKYVGETEKNLDRIFAEADRVNGVLLFDEADAIFGKRSDVKDAHDRYANVEVAYLLQRMESFDGLAILTTNLRANVDDAFTRRLDAVIDFPHPEEDDRLRLWRLHLRSTVPRTDDVDLEFLARSFRLSGGNVRNVALSAAYLAASEGHPVAMANLIRATEAEYRKRGHLVLESEFGPWFPFLTEKEGTS
jgi:ATPase family associated with various cellular activities (AAA)